MPRTQVTGNATYQLAELGPSFSVVFLPAPTDAAHAVTVRKSDLMSYFFMNYSFLCVSAEDQTASFWPHEMKRRDPASLWSRDGDTPSLTKQNCLAVPQRLTKSATRIPDEEDARSTRLVMTCYCRDLLGIHFFCLTWTPRSQAGTSRTTPRSLNSKRSSLQVTRRLA